jgi:hypothetical protein
MELTIDKELGGSVYLGHGALQLPDGEVNVEILVKYDEVKQEAALHLDETRRTMVNGKPVLKFSGARTPGVPTPKPGDIIGFTKFFIDIQK